MAVAIGQNISSVSIICMTYLKKHNSMWATGTADDKLVSKKEFSIIMWQRGGLAQQDISEKSYR